MGYLINENLIWVITPKCASSSIENAILKSNLKLKRYDEFSKGGRHIHVSLNECLKVFGKKESVCIKRDWFEKWLSALNFIWDNIEMRKQLTPICKWEDVNNEVIYKIFDDEFTNVLYSLDEGSAKQCFLKLLKNDTKNITEISEGIYGMISVLMSDRYWKSNQKCTYEFDISELDKFVKFIDNRFDEKLVIEKINTSTKRPNKIILNDEFKSFVWEKFENRFEKRNQLI
jgi:hypothetical protein